MQTFCWIKTFVVADLVFGPEAVSAAGSDAESSWEAAVVSCSVE